MISDITPVKRTLGGVMYEFDVIKNLYFGKTIEVVYTPSTIIVEVRRG